MQRFVLLTAAIGLTFPSGAVTPPSLCPEEPNDFPAHELDCTERNYYLRTWGPIDHDLSYDCETDDPEEWHCGPMRYHVWRAQTSGVDLIDKLPTVFRPVVPGYPLKIGLRNALGVCDYPPLTLDPLQSTTPLVSHESIRMPSGPRPGASLTRNTAGTSLLLQSGRP